jgi:hypothetical protein
MYWLRETALRGYIMRPFGRLMARVSTSLQGFGFSESAFFGAITSAKQQSSASRNCAQESEVGIDCRAAAGY